MKKVVIHGATSTSNFGDVLFAHLFYKKCLALQDVQVDFLQNGKYGIGDFLRKELLYDRTMSKGEFLKSDVFVFMSGGYFGEHSKAFIRNGNIRPIRIIKWYFRYFLPAVRFQKKGKPIFILGIGGGPVTSRLLRKTMVSLMEKAVCVTVRDEETRDYFKRYGVKREILVTTDTAQVYTPDMLPPLEGFSLNSHKKHLFLHMNLTGETDALIATKIAPSVIRFLEEHKDYDLVVGCDCVAGVDRIQDSETYKAIKAKEIVAQIYPYADSHQFAALLNRMDLIVTTKLHVGIVGATLGKSVVSFPSHKEKTKRYYRQIGEEGRSVPLKEVTPEQVEAQLEKYYNKPIILPTDIYKLAEMNLSLLEKINDL